MWGAKGLDQEGLRRVTIRCPSPSQVKPAVFLLDSDLFIFSRHYDLCTVMFTGSIKMRCQHKLIIEKGKFEKKILLHFTWLP